MSAEFSLRAVPKLPSIYALYAGKGPSRYVASVGSTSSTRHRLDEHLIRRNSSVATGVAAVALNVDLLTEVAWWTDPEFGDREVRHAAELVAFDVLGPVLRSRGRAGSRVKKLAETPAFRRKVRRMLLGPPSGALGLVSDMALAARVSELERRVSAIEGEAKGSSRHWTP